MVRKRLYAKQTASVEYEQIDLFSLLEEEQRQVDRTAEQVRGYEITVGHVAVQRLRARGADDETIAAVAAEYRENRLRGLGRRNRLRVCVADRRREQARRRCRHARRNHAATCGKTFHTILRHGKQH